MSIDQQLRDAGSRLAEVPVEVPELDGLLRHRRRARSLAMSGAVAVLVVALGVGIIALDAPSDGPVAADGRRPVTTDPIGLAGTGGIWPNEDLARPSIEETVDAFATDVLGWTDASLDIESSDPATSGASGPTRVTVTSGGHSISTIVAPVSRGWRLIAVGHPARVEVGGTRTRIHLPDPPGGAVEARWWAIADGVEHRGTHTDLDAPLDLPSEGRPARLASLVVFLDADGLAIDAVGYHFDHEWDGQPEAVEEREVLPTYRLTLPGAGSFSYRSSLPAVVDTVVWFGAGARQPYLSLNLRLAASEAAMTPTGFGPMTEDPDFAEAEGRAWFTTDDGGPVRSMRMWWVRPDDSVWLLTMAWPEADGGIGHADALDQMRAWALAIEAPPSGDVADYALPLGGVERIAFDEWGTIRSGAQVWHYRDEEIVLSVSEAVATGLQNALALDEVRRIAVDAQLGWRGIDPEGRTVVSWHRPGANDLWVRLLIPASLASEVDDVVAALERE